MADAKEHIYITGSNAKMLSREIETTLGGRFFARHITPYAFGEYLTACGIPHDEPALLGTKTNGKIRAACACPEADVQFISGGTQSNAIVIASMLQRWQGVVACRNRCCTRQNGSIFPAYTRRCFWATSSRGTASATIMR